MSEAFEVIHSAHRQGDVELAYFLIKDHLRRHKEDGRGWELLGLIQHARGRFRRSNELRSWCLFIQRRACAWRLDIPESGGPNSRKIC